VTVTAADAYGNRVPGYVGTIHFTSSDPAAVMPADYAFLPGDAGVHAFASGLTLKTAGSRWVRATDTVTTSITGAQSGIVVTPGAAKTLVVRTATTFVAGGAHSVTVTVKDAYGNTATGYTGTIHFTSSDSAATLPANYTFTGADAGVHVFASGLTLRTVGTQSVRATDTVKATITGVQSGIVVTPGTAKTFVVSTAATFAAGATHSVTVTAKDAYGNTVTGYVGTIHFTSSDSAATLPADYTFTGADAGVHVFATALTLQTAGTQWVRATDTVTATITGVQNGIAVS